MSVLTSRLAAVLDPARVLTDQTTLERYAGDTTECEPRRPDVVARVRSSEEVQAVVRVARELGAPIVQRVAGSNVGGLTIPMAAGIILDCTEMRAAALDREAMIAVVEPGVTFGAMQELLAREAPDLRIGYSLSPPDTSVLANALLDGLTNLGLRFGTTGEWVTGLEAVLADGTVLRAGSWALTGLPLSRGPLPDLVGLFIGWQGATGVVTKLALQLFPAHPLRRRQLLLAYDRRATFEAMRRLARLEVLDDMGGLTWPTAKYLFGITHPTAKDPHEPEAYTYLDYTADDEEELALKSRRVARVLGALRAEGHRFEDPIDVTVLARLSPRLARFADFPTRLDFLLDHPGGGLTWIGTYGPLARFEEAADAGCAILAEHGFPPTLVTRPMKGGHFGVLRFVILFDKADAGEVSRVRRANAALLDCCTALGFAMYKMPTWAWHRIAPRLDSGYRTLLERIKSALDPQSIMNPGRLGLRPTASTGADDATVSQ